MPGGTQAAEAGPAAQAEVSLPGVYIFHFMHSMHSLTGVFWLLKV